MNYMILFLLAIAVILMCRAFRKHRETFIQIPEVRSFFNKKRRQLRKTKERIQKEHIYPLKVKLRKNKLLS